MRKLVIALFVLAALGFVAPRASADPVLFEGLYYQNGVTGSLTTAPAEWGLSAFDMATGLGTITATFAPGVAGAYSLGVFLDIEIDESMNGFSNEYGAVAGSTPGGLYWEIDEPGFTYGDIYSNFAANTLDFTNGVPGSAPDDVSAAFMWWFVLAAGEQATLSWTVSEAAPAGGFYLSQVDPDSNYTIYFTANATITEGAAVPEPGSTLLLLGFGLVSCARGLRRR